MPTLTDDAVCLRYWDWSETSQTVSLLTESHGIIRGVAKGSRRPKSLFSGGFEALTAGEMVAITKNSGAMANVIEWDLRSTYPGLRRSLLAFHAGLYAADLVNASFSEDDPHPGLYRAILQLLAVLDESTSDAQRETALAFFQWALLTEAGYRPELDPPGLDEADAAERSFAFDAERGVLTADRALRGKTSRGAWRVRRETVLILRAIRDGEDPGCAHADARRANRLLASYLSRVLGKRLNSADALFGPAASEEQRERG